MKYIKEYETLYTKINVSEHYNYIQSHKKVSFTYAEVQFFKPHSNLTVYKNYQLQVIFFGVEILINKFDDDWYTMMCGLNRHYKCDTFEGVKQCFFFIIKEIKNDV